MNLVGKKIWGSLSLDKIKEVKQKAPKRFKNSEQYGNQMTFDARQWDDGGISLSASYQDESGEWQRITLGNIRLSKDQGDANTSNTPYQKAADTDNGDFPF